MMRIAVKCLIGISVLASPCAYDTDPREPSAVVAITAKQFSSNLSAVPEFADNAPAVRE